METFMFTIDGFSFFCLAGCGSPSDQREEEEMQQVFDKNEEYALDNFICFSTTNQSFLRNGQE